MLTTRKACLMLGFLLLFGSAASVSAATDPPPQYTLANAGVVILAKIDSVQDGKMVVSVLDVWKGKSSGPLDLTLGPAMENLKPGTTCVLCRVENLTDKNTVGESYFFGDVDWICMPVHSDIEKQQMKSWALQKK